VQSVYSSLFYMIISIQAYNFLTEVLEKYTFMHTLMFFKICYSFLVI